MTEERAIYKERPGYDSLWLYFGLSYAAWVTLPRVMMHEMPDEWQQKMSDLLNEWQDTYINMPDVGTRVQLTDLSGRLIKTPKWVINYRHPDKAMIDSLKVKKAKYNDEGSE